MRLADRLALGVALLLGVLSVVISDPERGAWLFRGVFVQDADEVIRAWYGRCAFDNPQIIPFSHLSMPGWTFVLALGEAVARALGLPLTLMGRLTTVVFFWAALRHAAAWLRAVGASESRAALAVAVLATSPGVFLMALTVYPEIALLALTLGGLRYLAEGRPLAAALTLGWAPLVRWEGALLLGLLLLVLFVQRAPWTARLAALGPYLVYLASVAWRFGNPWTPLAWRTTKAMGAWRLWNPDLAPGALSEALVHLATLFSPLLLVGALPWVPWILGRCLSRAPLALRNRRQLPLALAYAGLTVTLFSIQHDYMVYPLRVFAVPAALGAVLWLAQPGRVVPVVVVLAAAFTTGTGWRFVADRQLPEPGAGLETLGFHTFVRHADATPLLTRLVEERQGWLLVNHMNANLLRADDDCRLLERDLWIGGPDLSLSRDFRPTFGTPPGPGQIVFHALPFGVNHCVAESATHVPGQSVFRCPDGATPTSAP